MHAETGSDLLKQRLCPMMPESSLLSVLLPYSECRVAW
jgi:hypothetical protein